MTTQVAPEDVLKFWFPEGLARDAARHREQIAWWFRGGADAAILERFMPVLEAAIAGELAGWAATARGRLALIIVLDQFSRSAFRDTPRAFAQDPKAAALALEGVENGQYDQLEHVWEKLFFSMPFSHAEDLALQERSVALAQALRDAAPPHLERLYEFSLSQARGHRDVIARFGRHPHRNRILGRHSTPEELEHLAAGPPVHLRSLPE